LNPSGELELTFVNDACRAANLQLLLNSPRVPAEMKDLHGPFHQAFKSKLRGTRLNDAHASGASAEMKIVLANQQRGGHLAHMHKNLLPLAMEYMHTRSPEGLELWLKKMSWLILLTVIRWCEMVQLGGVIFQPAAQSQRNSNVMVQFPGPHGDIQIAAQVLALFVLKSEEDTAFAVISCYTALSDTDAKHDPYPQFGIVAGSLYYDEVEAPIVTRASNLLAPFAKTPFKLDYIEKAVIHVLPLYKVSNHSHRTECMNWQSNQDIYSHIDIVHDIEGEGLEYTN
jgi:hypothetical protein